MASQQSLMVVATLLASLALPSGPCLCQAANPEPIGDQPRAEQLQQTLGATVLEFRPRIEASKSGDRVHQEGKADEADENLFTVEGEGLEEQVDEVSYTIASLLFGFLVFDMIILYCINYPDPNIRSYVYRMISTTISIFCAVLINRAVVAFCIEQVLPAIPEIKGVQGIIARRYEKVILGFALFSSSFAIVNTLGWMLRKQRGKNYTYALRVIGGHITAFAGIIAFGHLQKIGLFGNQLATASVMIGLAVVVLGIARLFSDKCRDILTKRQHEKYAKLAVTCKEFEDEERPQWSEDVAEAEDDASALILSFLTQQVVVYIVTGELPPFDGSTASHTLLDMGFLFFSAIGFLLLLVFHTHVIIHFRNERARFRTGGEQSWRRHTLITQRCLAMSMSWCLLTAGSWGMRQLIESQAMAQVANALATTMVSLVIIRVLDCFADALVPQEIALDCHLSNTPFAFPPTPAFPTPGRQGSELSTISGPSRNFIWAQHTSLATEETEFQCEFAMHVKDAVRRFCGHMCKFFNASQEPLQRERALRRVIDGFGLLVGLCWDRAFDASDEILVEGSSIGRWHPHPAVAKLGLCVMLVSLVLPAWMWYVVPKARLGWRDHYAEMVGQVGQEELGNSPSELRCETARIRFRPGDQEQPREVEPSPFPPGTTGTLVPATEVSDRKAVPDEQHARLEPCTTPPVAVQAPAASARKLDVAEMHALVFMNRLRKEGGLAGPASGRVSSTQRESSRVDPSDRAVRHCASQEGLLLGTPCPQ